MSTRARSALSATLAVLGGLLCVVSLFAVWSRNQILNTDRYLTSVVPLASAWWAAGTRLVVLLGLFLLLLTGPPAAVTVLVVVALVVLVVVVRRRVTPAPATAGPTSAA